MPTPNHPDSPCIKLCQMDDAKRYCMGCMRTLNEIASWAGMSAEDKQKVLAMRELRMGEMPDQARPGSLPREPFLPWSGAQKSSA